MTWENHLNKKREHHEIYCAWLSFFVATTPFMKTQNSFFGTGNKNHINELLCTVIQKPKRVECYKKFVSKREILDSSVNHISNCVDASDAKLEKWNLGKRPSRNVTTRLDHWEFHSKERKEENSSFDSKNVWNSENYFWRWHSKNWTTVVHFRPLKHTLPSIYTLISITC